MFDSGECGDVALNSLVEADHFTPLVKELGHLDKVGYKGTVNRRSRADWDWESAKTGIATNFHVPAPGASSVGSMI